MSDTRDITERLTRLESVANWSGDDADFVEQLSRKLDVTRRIYERYDLGWRKVTGAEIGESSRSFLARVLCDSVVNEIKRDPQSPIIVKRLNVAYKAADYVAELSPAAAKDHYERLAAIDIPTRLSGASKTPVKGVRAGEGTDGVLPITVLFYEGPIARAYLETMAGLGLRPRKIVHLVSATDVASGEERLRWLPKAMRTPIAASMQRDQIFHWPAAIARQNPDVVGSIIDTVAGALDFDKEPIRRAQENKPLIAYSDNVERLLIKDLSDEVLLDYVQQDGNREYLFTGGGIVPASLLGVAGARFVHVHPGYLPDIRGADCLLWSILTQGRASAAAFYMAPGIDTGDILLRRWLPELRFRAAEIDLHTRYRMAYAFIDPWVRCYVLRELLRTNRTFDDVSSSPQDESVGTTFHFMHDKLRAMALDEVFSKS